MRTTAEHQIITVERQGGYAARCECGCGAITFGGFPSRTEARQAIAKDIQGAEDRSKVSEPSATLTKPQLQEVSPMTTTSEQHQEQQQRHCPHCGKAQQDTTAETARQGTAGSGSLARTVGHEIALQLRIRARSRASLADALGISTSSLSRRLIGETPFDFNELEAAAAWLDVDVQALTNPPARP